MILTLKPSLNQNKKTYFVIKKPRPQYQPFTCSILFLLSNDRLSRLMFKDTVNILVIMNIDDEDDDEDDEYDENHDVE